MGAELILRFLWRFKFPLVCGLLLLALAGAVKLYAWEEAKQVAIEIERDEAIRQHDALAAETAKQRQTLVAHAGTILTLEKDNARLRGKIRTILEATPQSAEWGRAAYPADLCRVLPGADLFCPPGAARSASAPDY